MRRRTMAWNGRAELVCPLRGQSLESRLAAQASVRPTEMNAAVWHPVVGIDGPCSDISFSRALPEDLVITMHFSLVRGLPNQDLQLSFSNVCALHWEDEFPGLYPMPESMAKCANSQWARWVFPLQKIEGSELLQEHQRVRETGVPRKLAHFLLISMNDLVHVIAGDEPRARWVPGMATAGPEA
jgi:hypothetical protein